MKRPRKRVEQAGYIEGPKDGSFYMRYWSEPDASGKRTRRAVEIGSKNQFKSCEEAKLSVEAALLRRRINAGVMGKTMGQVIALYERDAMPQRANTRKTVQAALFHCREAWAEEQIAVLADPTHSKRIEGWLNGLRSRPTKNRESRPLARTTKHCIKVQMGMLFGFAMQRGYIPSTINPMTFVRLAKGEDPPRRQTLTVDQMWAFFDDPNIPEHVKVMAHVARLTGLRISEILGLKEADFDLDKMLLQVHRRMFLRDVDGPKSKRSGDPIPFPEELYKILSAWLKSPNRYATPEGWLFASYVTGDPLYASELRRSYVKPWGEAHGIVKFGWHTFRHTYKQFLEDSGVNPVVIQRLMRHASYQVTAGYGSGVDLERLRDGQEKAAETRSRPQLVVKRKRWA
jgi:integrase